MLVVLLLLGFFYYTIGNLSPKFQSSLKAIQLVAVVKSSIIEKYGTSVILRSFMDDIRILEDLAYNKANNKNKTTLKLITNLFHHELFQTIIPIPPLCFGFGID